MITHLGVIIEQSNLISEQKYEFHEHFLLTKESFKQKETITIIPIITLFTRSP